MKNIKMLYLALSFVFFLISTLVAAGPAPGQDVKTLEHRGDASVTLCATPGWINCQAVRLHDRKCHAARPGMSSIGFPAGVTCNLWSTDDCTYPGGDFDQSFVTLERPVVNLADVGPGWTGRAASLQCWTK